MNTIAMLTKLFPKTKNISEVAEILEETKKIIIPKVMTLPKINNVFSRIL